MPLDTVKSFNWLLDIHTLRFDDELPTDDRVDRLARAILATGNVVHPLIIRYDGFVDCEPVHTVLPGQTLLLAAIIRANELNPRFDQVTCSIIQDKPGCFRSEHGTVPDPQPLLEQLAILQCEEPPQPQPTKTRARQTLQDIRKEIGELTRHRHNQLLETLG